MTIAQNILDGRKVIEEYRVKHKKLYEEGKVVIEGHKPLIIEMRKKLQELGFKDFKDFLEQSKEAEILEKFDSEEKFLEALKTKEETAINLREKL